MNPMQIYTVAISSIVTITLALLVRHFYSEGDEETAFTLAAVLCLAFITGWVFAVPTAMGWMDSPKVESK